MEVYEKASQDYVPRLIRYDATGFYTDYNSARRNNGAFEAYLLSPPPMDWMASKLESALAPINPVWRGGD